MAGVQVRWAPAVLPAAPAFPATEPAATVAGRLGIRVIEVDCSRGLADVAELVAEAFPAHLPLGPDAALIVVDV